MNRDLNDSMLQDRRMSLDVSRDTDAVSSQSPKHKVLPSVFDAKVIQQEITVIGHSPKIKGQTKVTTRIFATTINTEVEKT